jgi:hypothetical protein
LVWRGEAQHGLLKKENEMQTIINQFKYTTKYSKEVIDEILMVKEKFGLTAENLVTQASKRGSSLKCLFEWNDEECGRIHREQQARIIINEIKMIVEDKEIYAFENISINVENTNSREYFDAIEIQEDKNKSQQVAMKAYEQILYWKEKYEMYIGDMNEFIPVFEEIKKLEKRMKK